MIVRSRTAFGTVVASYTTLSSRRISAMKASSSGRQVSQEEARRRKRLHFHSSHTTRGPLIRPFSSSASSSSSKSSSIPVFSDIKSFRKWREGVGKQGRSVGFVPTMGALHEGHLSLVRQSLSENDETVVSIFVNPAQFAPTEDLNSYPRTLESDMEKLVSLQSLPTSSSASASTSTSGVSAIFAPTVTEMYPSPDGRPFTQHVKEQVGAFVEVQGLAHQMEGASRPTFFRGVATVCTKLFHVVQPDLAYFGQKDIQQAIILRRLVSDLLFSHPPGAQAVRVMKTSRDGHDGLALSSRNAYLTATSRKHASILYKALSAGKEQWESSSSSVPSSTSTSTSDDVKKAAEQVEAILQRANESATNSIQAARADGVTIELLYISLNDPVSLQDLSEAPNALSRDRGAILSAAALIKEGDQGRVTRLIDNLLLGFSL